MDFLPLSIESEIPSLPVEMYENIVSVSGFSQLLELSDVNSLFRSLVITEVKRRLKKMKEATVQKGLDVNIFPICFYLTEFNDDFGSVKQNVNEIKISGRSFILKFLRLFGTEMKYVVCDFFGATEEQACTIFSHVGQYCLGLNRLAFGNLNYDLDISLERTFENVTYIFFQRCKLYAQLCDLKNYFPNAKEIVFSEENRFENIDKMIVNYGYLERFEICSASMDVINAIFLQILNPDAEVSYYGEANELFLMGFDV